MNNEQMTAATIQNILLTLKEHSRSNRLLANDLHRVLDMMERLHNRLCDAEDEIEQLENRVYHKE